MKQEDEFEKHPSLHYASLDEDFKQILSSFFNIFSDDPHVGTLIIRFYLVCLIIGQTLGEGTI